MSTIDTPAELNKILRFFIQETTRGLIHHITKSYTGAEKFPGIAICLVACPDEVAKKLHDEFDELVHRIFAEHGLRPVQKQ